MKRVLILDGSVHPDIYRPADEWRMLMEDVPSDVVHLPSGDRIPEVSDYSHMIVTGSEASITEPAPWYERESRAIVEAEQKNLSILGSCFGHQMLAVALSGPEYAVSSKTPEIGWTEVEFTAEDELFRGLPNPFWVFSSHFDEVRSPPAPWKTLASTDRCDVHIMRYGEKNIWGIQAHPEIPPDDAIVLLKGFVEKFPEKADLIRPALESEPKDDGIAYTIVSRFLELP